jgi:hypothetical protein
VLVLQAAAPSRRSRVLLLQPLVALAQRGQRLLMA